MVRYPPVPSASLPLWFVAILCVRLHVLVAAAFYATSGVRL